MKVAIKRFDTSLPLPEYKTSGAACVDLCARIDTTIQPGEPGLIPLNVALEIPEGYWVLLASRGSTFKSGLMPANGIGIGDWDYRGDNDEYHFPVINFTKKPVTIERGQRIAQMMVVKYEKIDFNEVDRHEHTDRGAFGSTGKK